MEISSRFIKTALQIFYAMSVAVVLSSCTKSGNFKSDSCLKGNANCDSPSMSVGVVGGDEDKEETTSGDETTVATVQIKTIRVGEKAIIEFVMKNPKLTPLIYQSFSMAPGDAAFTAGAGVSVQDCTGTTLLYQQKCAVSISFSPSMSPPPEQILTFRFKTLLGGDFVFRAGFDPAKVLEDFYISENDLVIMDTLVYDSGNAGWVEKDIPIYNYGSENDLTNMQFALNGSSDFSFGTAATTPCVEGQSLAKSGGTCNIRVKFKPTTQGEKSSSLVITSASGVSREYMINGTAVIPTSSAEVLDFGSALLNSAASAKTYSISVPASSGDPAASSCSYSISGDAAFVISNNTCGASIASGATCNIEVTWTPAAANAEHLGELSWTCDSRGGGRTIPLIAHSVTSTLVADVSTLNFGNVLIGSATTKTFKFKNLSSSAALTDFSRTLTQIAGASFTLDAETCTTGLASSGECDYTVKFSPTAVQSYSAEVAATSTETTMDYNVSVLGAGVGLEISKTLIDFGSVPTKVDRVGTLVTITNPSSTESASSCALTYDGLTAQNFSIDSDSTCLTKTSFAASESCTFKTRFTGALPVGARESTVTMTCAIGGSVSLNLKGLVETETRLVIVPPSQVSFVDRLVGITQDVEFVMANNHATESALNVAITPSPLPAAWTRVAASAADCSGVTDLTAGQICRVKLRYAPSSTPGSEQTGTLSGVLSVSADAGSINPTDGAYSGEAKVVSANPSTVDFGTFTTGMTQTSATVTFYNPSGIDYASDCALAISTDFEIMNSTCSDRLAPLANCSAQIRISPQSSSKVFSGNLDNVCGVGGRARVVLSGTAQKKATIAWSGTASFGNVDLNRYKDQTLTVTHVGNVLDAATVNLQISISATKFTIQSHNCPVALAPAESCNVIVRYSPTAVGADAATLTAASTPESISEVLNLSGTGLDPATRLVPDKTAIDLSGHLLGSTTNEVITFTNTAVEGNSGAIAISNSTTSSYFSVPSPDCETKSLAPAETCTTTLQYTPAQSGDTTTHSGSFTATATAASGAVVTKTVNYLAAAKKIESNLAQINFGDVDLGSVKVFATPIEITNPSTLDDATTCTYNVSSPFQIKSGSNTCGATITKNTDCQFEVELPSQTVEANLTGTATISCLVGGTLTLPISAAAKELPSLAWSGNNDFAYLDTSRPAVSRVFTLTNTESFSADLTSLGFVASDSAFSITGQTCTVGGALAAGASCTVTVAFDTADENLHSVTLRAETKRTGSSDAVVPIDYVLSGTGSHMTLDYSATTLTFAVKQVGSATTEQQSVTVTNNGTRPAYLTYPTSMTAPPFAKTGGTCGATLNAAASCTLTFTAYADTVAGVHSETYDVVETNHSVADTDTITLEGESRVVPTLRIKDDRANTTYTTTIATSDITGATDNANNIADLTPAYRDVTFTVSSTTASASAMTLGTATLAHSSGQVNTMAIQSDNCSTTTLTASSTCTIVVRYTPTTNAESSNYTISLIGTDVETSATQTVTVTTIKGTSIKAPHLTITMSNMTFTPIESAATADSSEFSIQNTGDQTASLVYSFTGTDSGKFSKVASGAQTLCGATLSGGLTCYYKVRFTPAEAGAFSASLAVSASNASENSTANIKASGYKQTLQLGLDEEAFEPTIAADSSYVYIVSKWTDASSFSNPVLTICNRTAKGAVDYSNCTKNILNSGSNNKLSGTFVGAGPRIVVGTNMIVMLMQNQEVGLGGNATSGNATLVVCKKPGASRTVTFGADCSLFNPHSSASIAMTGAGLSPSLAISGTKVYTANQYDSGVGTSGFVISACDFNDSTTTPSSAVTVTSCKAQKTLTLNTSAAQSTSISVSGSKLVMAATDKSNAAITLSAIACDVAGDNTFTCGSYTVVDNSTITYGSTQYPGFYPSVVLDGSRFYVAHQQGENNGRRLRLSDCTASGANALSCSNQTVLSSSDTTGLGVSPSIAISGSGSTGKLWILHTILADTSQLSSAAKGGVVYCSLAAGSPSCQTSNHYTQPSNVAEFYELPIRSSYFDSTNKIFIFPFTSSEPTTGTWFGKLGIFNFGLTPEL